MVDGDSSALRSILYVDGDIGRQRVLVPQLMQIRDLFLTPAILWFGLCGVKCPVMRLFSVAAGTVQHGPLGNAGPAGAACTQTGERRRTP